MRLRSLLASGVFIAGLAAGQAMAAETVTFWQFFTGDTDVAAWKAAIAKFEAANPDIKVNMELVPWSEQQQRFVTALATGGLPDVSMLGNNVVAQFQATGSLAPLDEYVAAYDKANGTKIEDDIWPGDKGYYILDGHLWASPIAVETRALYYRKDLFKAAGLDPEKPPQTWEDLATASAALSKAGAGKTYGIGLPMSLTYNTVQNFMSTWLGYGARMIGDDGKCGFNTPEFKQALDVYTRVYKNGGTHPDAPTMDGDTFRRGFIDGGYAMAIFDASLYKQLENEKAPFIKDVGIAKIPAGAKNRSGFLGGWPLVLWSASEHKDAAAKWILFATHGEVLKDMAVASGYIPGNITLAKGSPWDAFPYPLFVEQLQDAKPYQYPAQAIPQMGQLEVDTVQKAVQAVALGKQDVDQATAQLCSTINDVLSR
jgi:ABC-type glycerol-3-phosphate transport system substrate-binding protein